MSSPLAGSPSQDVAPGPEASGRAAMAVVRGLVVRFALMAGFVAMLLYFTWQTPLFLTRGNLITIAQASAVLLVVAVPMTVLVIMGLVDLSIGSILAITAVSVGLLINGGTHWTLAALAGIALGAAIGAFNGALVCYLRLSPIVVTLGMLQLLRGATMYLTERPPSSFGEGMALLGRGIWMSLPVPVWIALAVFALGAFYLYVSVPGRHTYAIGTNAQAAFLSGVRTQAMPTIAYAVTGAATGLGGVLVAARLDSAPPATVGQGFELQVLTAVLLGGVAFTGGRGTMAGALLGVVFLGVLQNGLVLLDVSSYGQQLSTGIALVAAAALDEIGLRQGRVRAIVQRPR